MMVIPSQIRSYNGWYSDMPRRMTTFWLIGSRYRNMGAYPAHRLVSSMMRSRALRSTLVIPVGLAQVLIGRSAHHHGQVRRHGRIAPVNLIPYQIAKVAVEGVIGGLGIVRWAGWCR